MPRELSDDGNRHAVPCLMICPVARGRQNVAVGQSHQAHGFAGGYQPGPDTLALDDAHDLPGRSACGSAKAARDAIEPRFGSQHLFSAAASSALAGSSGQADSGGLRGIDLRQVRSAHHRQKSFGFGAAAHSILHRAKKIYPPIDNLAASAYPLFQGSDGMLGQHAEWVRFPYRPGLWTSRMNGLDDLASFWHKEGGGRCRSALLLVKEQGKGR